MKHITLLLGLLFFVCGATMAEDSTSQADKDFQKDYKDYTDFQKKEADRIEKQKMEPPPVSVPIDKTTRAEPTADPYGAKIIKSYP